MITTINGLDNFGRGIGIYNGKVLGREVSKEQAIYEYGAYACEYCINQK